MKKKIQLNAWFSDFFKLFENTNFLLMLLFSFIVKSFLYVSQIIYALVDGYIFLVFISLYASLKDSKGDLSASFKRPISLIPRLILVSLCIIILYIPVMVFLLMGLLFSYAEFMGFLVVSLIMAFIISLFISFVPYLIIIDDYSAIDSIRKSYELVKENFFQVLLISIINILIAIPNFFLTFNNLLFAAYLTFYSALSVYLVYRLYCLILGKRAKKYKQKQRSK